MNMQSLALAIVLTMSSSFALAQSSGMGVSILPPGAQTKPKAEEPKTTGSATRSDNSTNAGTDNRVKKTTGNHSPATNGSRECAPDEGLREAVHPGVREEWIASAFHELRRTGRRLRSSHDGSQQERPSENHEGLSVTWISCHFDFCD